MRELWIVEKLYEDGWSYYCGYATEDEAKMRANIVEERDNRKTRITLFRSVE